MRRIERAGAFRRDYRRVARGYAGLDRELMPVLEALALDQPLAAKHRDHALGGDWQGYRECHVRPDLLLIYVRLDAETLHLVRLGSHAELFG